MSGARNRTTYAVASMTLAGAVLAGCSNGDPALVSLESDPVVTAQIPGLHEIQLFGQIGFTAAGKRQQPTLTRYLTTTSKRIGDADLAAAAAAAGEDGWSMSPDAGGFVGTKRLAGATVDLQIVSRKAVGGGRLVALVLSRRA